MTPQKLAALKAALVRLREETLDTGPAKIEPNRTDAASVGVADEDAQALSEMMQTLASQRNKKQSELLGQIDRALAKLDGDPEMVGLCEECEEEIGDKRLSLLPYAALCAECQQKHDPRRGGTRKSLTDYR